MLKLAILGSGYGSNFQAIIDAIEFDDLSAEIACVISDVKDAHILTRAQNNQIPSYYVDCSPFKTVLKESAEKNLISILKEHEPDYIILAGFMRIIKMDLLHTYNGKIINIHPSLLPNFPGLNAGKQAFDAKVDETGCTVHYVDEGIDTGKIILQEKVKINKNDSLEVLMKKIHEAEHRALPKAIKQIINKSN
ncbi:MAG: phosphoribosylglycinamide formyltransferase [Pontiellaceae bacterium]